MRYNSPKKHNSGLHAKVALLSLLRAVGTISLFRNYILGHANYILGHAGRCVARKTLVLIGTIVRNSDAMQRDFSGDV